MTNRSSWTRRWTLASLAAGLAARAGGAFPQPTTGTRLEPPRAAPTDGALLETAFDQALRMTVPVFLNGKGPFQFVVDTGANSSVVSTEVAGVCRLPEAGTAPVHGIISAEPAPMVRVGRVRVGGVITANLKVPMVPQSRLGAAGILGLDMMHDRRLLLGFRDQSFSISPSGSGAQLGRTGGSRLEGPYQPVTVPARYRSGQLVILDGEAAGQSILAFLDSGSQVTVANRVLRDLAFAARPDLAQRVIHSELISATGQRAPAEFARLPDLRLGGQRLQSPLVAFADLHIFELWNLVDRPTVLIGVDILRLFDQVGFDFSRKLITFWPARRRPGPVR
jgi:hypothetical protein